MPPLVGSLKRDKRGRRSRRGSTLRGTEDRVNYPRMVHRDQVLSLETDHAGRVPRGPNKERHNAAGQFSLLSVGLFPADHRPVRPQGRNS